MTESSPRRVAASSRLSKPPLVPFLLALGGAALGFLGATSYAQLRAAGIESAAREISSIAMPGVELLADARTLVRQEERAADELVDGLGDTEQLTSELQTIPGRLERLLGRYRGLPHFPGVEAIDAPIPTEAIRLATAIGDVQTAIAAGNVLRAREALGGVRTAADRLDHFLGMSLELDAARGADLAAAIAARRHAGLVYSILLHALALLLTVIAGLFAAQVLRAYARTVEERTRELETFAARMAHDVMSPLTTINLSIGVARSRLPDDASLQATLARADSASRRTAEIIRDLLHFARAGARPEEGARSRLDVVLAASLDEIRPQADKAGIGVTLEAIEPIEVACAAGLVAVMVTNLLRNAIKYMGDRTERRITLRALDRDRVARVEVEDSGPGVPRGMEEAIFDEYVRVPGTGQPGLGLGLATVRRISERHGGRAGVRPAPAEGACFFFELPKVA